MKILFFKAKNFWNSKIISIGVVIGYLTFYNELKAQNFLPPRVDPYDIELNGISPNPTFVDLDGDGDMDFYTTGLFKFFFQENIGTNEDPIFNPAVENPFNLDMDKLDRISVTKFADLDGDGDLDMLIGNVDPYYDASYSAWVNFKYFENEGTINNHDFVMANDNPFGLTGSFRDWAGLSDMELVDIDDDGDLDLFEATGPYTLNFVFRENIGSENNDLFDSQERNPFGLKKLYGYYMEFAFGDLDNDGDLDIIAIYEYGKVFIENIGSKSEPRFEEPVPLPDITGSKPALVDLTGDGDLDLLTFANGEILYYENAMEEFNDLGGIKVHPNPAISIVSIETTQMINSLSLSNTLGQTEFFKGIGNSDYKMDVDHLKSGVYFLTITLEDGNKRCIKVLKE